MSKPKILVTSSAAGPKGSETNMSRFKMIYERLRPLIVWLGLTELAWIAYWLLSPGEANPRFVAIVFSWIILMLVWMTLVIYAGTRGFFLKHTRWLSNFVGVLLVLALAVVLFVSTDAVRAGLVNAASATTDRQLISIHVLRLLAIGTVVKYLQGQLPRHFVILGSLPDFLFAISAVVLTTLAANGPLGRDALIVWHIVGFVLFLGPGFSMFFSMPSPLRIYDSKPDASIVFQFPMLLAPNFTVPMFMLAHGFALVKLLAT